MICSLFSEWKLWNFNQKGPPNQSFSFPAMHTEHSIVSILSRRTSKYEINICTFPWFSFRTSMHVTRLSFNEHKTVFDTMDDSTLWPQSSDDIRFSPVQGIVVSSISIDEKTNKQKGLWRWSKVFWWSWEDGAGVDHGDRCKMRLFTLCGCSTSTIAILPLTISLKL